MLFFRIDDGERPPHHHTPPAGQRVSELTQPTSRSKYMLLEVSSILLYYTLESALVLCGPY